MKDGLPVNKTEPIKKLNKENQLYGEWINTVDEILFSRLGKISVAFNHQYDLNKMFLNEQLAESSAEYIINHELLGHD